jgi:xanthine dehydrogenase accessory factor
LNEWLDELADLGAAGEAAVLVTVAAVRGSAPREPGAKMIVTALETIGTIGGGQLEYQCSRLAVDILGANERPSMRRFPLGAAMGQCCGGVVEILFEPLGQRRPNWLAQLGALHAQRVPAVLVTGIGETGGKFVVSGDGVSGPDPGALPAPVLAASQGLLAAGGQAGVCGSFLLEPVIASAFNIAVFGAGHVGAAVTEALSRVDCNIRWIDSRRRVFRDLPRNVRAIESDDPPREVGAMPAGSYYLVMTHSHALDFAVCERILGRDDVAYCGLIGSLAKRRRFEKRFRAQGISEAALARLTCPIGIPGIRGKKPAEIALATAAELLHVRDSVAAAGAPGMSENVRPFRRR